jgi:uncharacterized protein
MKHDPTDAELDELDELLRAAPASCQPLDLLMLDGYLVGVLVQPRLVSVEEWLAPVFDVEGRALGAETDAVWLARCRKLIERRQLSLNAAISEDGWFDPLLVDTDREPPVSEYDAVQAPVSRALLPWVAGFHWAQECFADLSSLDDEAIDRALAHIYLTCLPRPTKTARPSPSWTANTPWPPSTTASKTSCWLRSICGT